MTTALTEHWTERMLAGCPGLARHDRGPQVARVAAAALAAVDPRARIESCVHRLVKPRGVAAVVGEYVFDLADDPQAPGPAEHGRIWVFGAGKASAAMAAALEARLGDHIAGGLIVTKQTGPPLARIEVVVGDHPLPGPRSIAAAAKLRARASAVGPRDLVLCPISGGASALLSEPLLPADQWADLVDHLLSREVSIQAINRLRRRFDALKAGGLARLFAPATVVGLVISDVVGDELALVGSGPTVYAGRGEAEAHRELLGQLDARLSGLAPELRARLASPPTLEPAPQHSSIHQVLVARNGDAREAGCHQARAEGLDSVVLLPALGGPAADEGRRLGRLLADFPADLPVSAPACLITGGETVVDLSRGEVGGRGGRNQELALAAMAALAGRADCVLLTLASDGEDGPTDAAGAVVTGDCWSRAHELGLDPDAHLRAHDSYSLLSALGHLLRLGPTDTNVCDLAFLFRLSRGG